MEFALIFALAASFFLGVFVNQRINKHNITSEECKAISKKHKDVLNWLKSGLADTKKVKMGKRIDQNKVRLLELIIQRLEK